MTVITTDDNIPTNQTQIGTISPTYVPKDGAQAEFCPSWNSVYIRSTVAYIHIHKTALLAIQTPTQWNHIPVSITAPPPVLSPNSNVPQPSSHCAFILARRNSGSVLKKYLIFLAFIKLRKSEIE